MQGETKTCQNCKSQFTIEPDDFQFYEKIKVPAPTWCPECRLIRRLASRNERTLYRRACDLCKKATISRYAPDSPYTVYCSPCWWSDNWDPFAYGRDHDFSKPFFVQFHELALQVPKMSIFVVTSVNSEYCSQVKNVKNCYLGVSVLNSENISYSYRVDHSKDSYDLAYTDGAEQCYDLMYAAKCFGVTHSWYTQNSYDSHLLFDCRNCRNATLCVNVRNGSYLLNNQQLTKEEYQKRIAELDLGSYRNLEVARTRLLAESLKRPRKFAQIEHSVNIVGDHIINSKNCFYCFDSNNIENCKYTLVGVEGAKDSYDISFAGLDSELLYEGWSLIGSRVQFAAMVQNAHDAQYSEACTGGGNLFGCNGLKNGEYCILNKRYDKQSYEALRARIVEHMNTMPYTDVKGRVYRYGEFFPTDFSPFAYNESQAYDHFPLTKEEILACGYRWRDPEAKRYDLTLRAQDIPDNIRKVTDDILTQTIGCEHDGKCSHQCSGAFKLLSQELQFYRAKNIPLPRLCSNCRYYRRMEHRSPVKLWHRSCACAGQKSENGVYANTAGHFHGTNRCPNEFETSYAPDRPEIVYCEQCYNAEVV